jgi:phosphoribosyl 1,2-cyclic phosphodiesterase
VRLTFLGVRGSTGAPGRDFVRYGGHTSCVAVTATGEPTPTLVLDAGTGIAGLSALLGGDAYRGDILVSHLHWDHVQGLPFCRAVDRADSAVRVHVPAQDGATALGLLSQAMSPPSFPITPEGLDGDWTFATIEPGELTIGRYRVVATEVSHKGGRTYGYRVELDGLSLGYVPDHVPADGVSDATRDSLRDVDVLIHDAQFLQAERALATAYGHATVGDAVDLALEVGARHLVLFHHGPARTDDRLDSIGHDLDGAADRVGTMTVSLAREGLILDLPTGHAG